VDGRDDHRPSRTRALKASLKAIHRARIRRGDLDSVSQRRISGGRALIYDRREPLAHNDEDEPLLEELRDLVRRADPVPREVVQLAEAAIQFRDLATLMRN